MALSTFVTVEGGLLPSQLLDRIVAADPRLDGTTPDTYHVESTTELNQAISRAWASLAARWAAYRTALAALPEQDRATTLTRERWLLPLFQELGFGRLPGVATGGLAGRAVSHVWGHVPVHLVGARLKLDSRVAGERGAATASPHGLVQDLLNHEESHLWAFLSNGLELRLLRDHRSLTRQAYIAFDLESIFDGEQFSAFRILYLLCHQSRVVADKPTDCWLEKWFGHARDEGIAAQEKMREGFERALCTLGAGFLKHPANSRLLADLAANTLSTQDYYRQLLRLVYRLIFLFVAEDRGVLLVPGDETKQARDRYARLYASGRLRRLAMRRRGGPHADGWQALLVVMRGLDRGCTELALPGLGSFLWGSEVNPARPGERRSRALPDLEGCSLANEALFEALHALCIVQDGPVRRRVDWASVQADELGSVYEALMERVPRLNAPGGFFELAIAAGNERKSTGSYYTPSPIVDCLLDGSLEPILDDASKKADPEKAILELAVVDPACGSGHFLVAAARRIARHLARVRAGGIEPSPPEVQHALRDVVGRCIFGVDLNPMAVELCKVSLWMEAIEPSRPLSFLDAHIQPGNALFGASPELMARGTPDVAWTALKGEDNSVATRLRRANQNWKQMGLFSVDPEHPDVLVATAAAGVDAADDATQQALEQKEKAWKDLQESAEAHHARLIEDLWCAAFVWPKDSREAEAAAPTRGMWEGARRDPKTLSASTLRILAELRDRFHFFHWHLAFPVVMGRGGFDLVLGNPPWDTLSPDQREFFGKYHASMRSLSPEEQEGAIARLVEDAGIRAAWERHCLDLFGLVHFLKNSGRFTLYAPGNLGKGDFNIYRMFAELALKQACPGGFAALVLPGGIYGGANASAIRKFIFDECELTHLYGLSNSSRGWFAQVDISRFAAFTARRGGRTKAFLAHFGLSGPSDLSNEPVEFDAEFIRRNAPDTYAVPDVRSLADLTVAAKMTSKHPPFGDTTAGPPTRHYQREIDMGTDRGLFTANPVGLPVYEGRMVSHYDHRFKTYDSGHGNSSVWVERDHQSPQKVIAPQWRVLPDNVPGKLGDRCNRYRIGFRDVAQPRDVRSFIATLIPPHTVCGHTVPTIIFEPEYEWAYLPWLAVANSFAMDAFTRRKLSSPHLTFSLLDSLPFPRPRRGQPWVERVAPVVLRLVCTSAEMTAYWNRMAGLGFCSRCPDGTVPAEAFTTEAERELARAELDAVVAHEVYGLTEEELGAVLESFPVVKRRDARSHGEFRTKRLVLAAFEVVATGGSSLPVGALGSSLQPQESSVAPGLDILRTVAPSALPLSIKLGTTAWRVMPWPHPRPPQDGEHIAVRQAVGAHPVLGLGKARVARQRDVRSGASLITLVVTGAGASAELSFTEVEWVAFRPFGLAERA